MKNSFLKKITGAAALFAVGLGITAAFATPTTFNGSYSQNFDLALTNSSTAMPVGFRSMVIAGANSTYTAASPITSNGVASATAATQTLIVWNAGAAVASSGTSLFNIGAFGNTSDRALGTDPTGTAANIIELSMTNITGGSLAGVTVSYATKCMTNGTSGTGTESAELPGYSFFYSLTGSTTAADWIKVTALGNGNYTQGTTSNTGPVNITFAAPLTNNGILYFRWADDNCQTISPDQMLGIDNISIATYNPSGPLVSLTAPASNASFLPGTNVTITASASESGGTITNVAFYSGSTKLGNVTNSPYSLTWSNVSIGAYALTAVASDAAGITATSAVVNITVAHAAPSIAIGSPASGASYFSPATIALSATASATDGTVTNVAFYSGTTFLANVAAAPYNYTWLNVPAGSYSLTAVAAADTGISATSSVVAVSVANPVTTSFTGAYSQNFDLDLTNSTTTMPAGFQAMGLAGDDLLYTNGIPITSNAIAGATAGTAALTVWNVGTAVTKAQSTLFNIGCWDSLNNRALGSDPTGNAATVIQLALKNNTGNSLNGVTFSYTERCLTNGSTSNGSYTDDGTERLELPGYSFFYSLVGDSTPTNWFQVDALCLTNWVQGTSTDSGPVTIIFPTPLPANGVMYFRWADDNCVASSPDQMYAIDNISIGLAQNVFQTAFNAGPGFFGGENLIFTNLSGNVYYAWSSPDPSVSVTNWTLEGQLSELPLGTSGYSRYGINLNPVTSPVYYIFAATNSGPYTPTEPLTSLTTADYSAFNVTGAAVPITAAGIFLIEGVTLVPTAQITSPASGVNYLPGTNVTLVAAASELNGLITNVEFFANATDLGGVPNSPYSLTWSNVPAGNYSLTVVASDAAGITATSAVVNITVSVPNVPPTVSLTSPTNNATFNVPASISLLATASDSDGSVTNVAFYQGSTLIANVASAPYSFIWTNVPAGTYSVTAVATDNSGASTTSTAANITVADLTVLQKVQQIKTIFVIALENHDLVQQNPTGSPQQLLGNPACPYFNSLITPGNSNAVQTAYATHYFSCAINGEHPSEPNYVWLEAGTDFGVRTDSDPTPGNNQWSNVQHLSGQLTTAGIAWKNYQEDVQYSSSEEVSASGSGAPVNPYNGTTDYNYAVKHNPMAFFTDTQNKNCYPLTNFWADLTNGNIGRYNWITPDQYNEMHSSLPSGYTYQGTAYTGDQAAIAEGDNFLSIVIPKIMASQAYKDHGVIIIWTDETESTDDTNTTLPYVIISPLAKGNAYASTLPYSHASVLKTMDEVFGLAFQTNAIPAGESDAQNDGKYNYVNGSSAVINDLSDFFQLLTPPVITVPGTITVEATNAAGNAVNFSVTATDIVDGAISPIVTPASGSVFPLGTNIVTATATDSNGLSATNTFAVIVRDTTPPVITLHGANPFTNFQSVAFVDPGATAYDVVSGSVPVSTNGTVDVTTLGAYTIKYAASDARGNSATNTRTVQVIPLAVPVNLGGAAVPGGSGSTFQLSFTAALGQPYRILGTDDLTQPLTNWTVLASGVVTNNPATFTDAAAVSNAFRFYRVVSP